MRRTSILALIAIAALALGPWSPGAARAFNPQPDPPGFGMIGLARGQTARLSVVALGGSLGEVCGIEPLPFHVAFHDSEGRVLAEARDLLLQPGQSAFLDLNGGHLLGRFGQRLQIRASVEGVRGAAFCGIATVELFSNFTGYTSVIYAGLP